MAAGGGSPDMVQVGNEIAHGMLWPQGSLINGRKNGWQRLASLLKPGIAAIREYDSTVAIMLHTELGGSPTDAQKWYQAAENYSLDYDIIGLSNYPVWHGKSLSIVAKNLNDLSARFGKDVCIVETSYPWTLIQQNDGEKKHCYQKKRSYP